jgi:S1-C subfamily serine protease
MQRKQKSLPAALGAILIVLVVVFSACSPTTVAPTPTLVPQATAAPVPTAVTATTAPVSLVPQAQVDYEEQLLVRIYEDVNPSVVNIGVTSRTSSGVPGFGNFVQEGQGSGFVWDTQGHIVTNNHVINGATAIQVTFPDGIAVSATVVGADPDSDLAVIKVNPADHELKPVVMGDSDALKVGQRAIAIGTPFGLESTLTAGVISAVGRDLPVDSGSSTAINYRIPDVIQTDAPINPGNSGGPLLNGSGEVIGVNSAIESTTGGSVGIGFAIPSAIVKQVVPSLIQTGSYRHPWLGVSVATLPPSVAEAMGLPRTQRGALVMEVTASGPADRAGLKASSGTTSVGSQQVPADGDVIVRIDSTVVSRSEDLISYLIRRTAVGQQITLTVLRDGKEMEITVTLGERPTTRDRVT